MKYLIRDKEAGNKICVCDTYEEAESTLENFEAIDILDGNYIEDFYEIVEIEQR